MSGLIALLAILPALVLDALLEGALALLLACAWVLTGVTTASEALSGFASARWQPDRRRRQARLGER